VTGQTRRMLLSGLPMTLMLMAMLRLSVANAGDADASFRLTAGPGDLASYYPTYLANGYVSTVSSARGTETEPGYLVGYMDHTAGDMARPAAVPGWSGVDFRDSLRYDDSTSLNQASLDADHFRNYEQVLDLHDGVLNTRYRYVDRSRQSDVVVTQFVSQANPHLAALRFVVTPDYDGSVRVSFPITLWAQSAPRFALGRLTGPEVDEAVTANRLSLKPAAPATPDRAALWYPGYTQISLAQANASTRVVKVEGSATQGLTMALAAAVALPAEVVSPVVTTQRDDYRVSLDVSLAVQRGHTYTFVKYIALSRADWGGDAQADAALVQQAREAGFDALLEAHRAAWRALWESDIQIVGDSRAQLAAHSELYYLLASSTADTHWALGACGLTTGYAGHIFWDSDTWIFPALLLLHPERARSLLAFREVTLPSAQARAHAHGFEGAMYPWESDPENGSEQTPHSAFGLGESEIHVNADVAIAQWQYFLASHDRQWLKQHGWPVIREVARFWASRASYDPRRRRYDIAHVNSVAESHSDIPNDTFTNVSAVHALAIAVKAARVVGVRADPAWARIERGLFIPMDRTAARHLPFDPSIAGAADDFGGGPLSLLFLPSLDLPMTDAVRRHDYAEMVGQGALARIAGVSMGIAPQTVAAASVGDAPAAAAAFDGNFSGGTLKAPFNVRTETAANNVGYFLTGSGGYLQTLLYGLSGLRLREEGLEQAFPPVLPAAWQSLTLRGLHLRGKTLDVRIERQAAGTLQVTRSDRR
jgi:protein-glucosylgalactosylhydroxylysine glucosidase